MKVYEKIVIDMKTMEVLEEVSYDYEGPVALMKGGGGGGSGGKVDYPSYMKTRHEDWLGDIDSRITSALSNNPFSGVTAYDPTSVINDIYDQLQILTEYQYDTNVGGYRDAFVEDGLLPINPFNNVSYFLSRLAAVMPAAESLSPPITPTAINYTTVESAINAAMNAHGTQLSNQITSDVLPKFKSGMLNIGAVVNSAYVIGEALIWARRNDEVSRATADVRQSVLAEVPKLVLERDRLIIESNLAYQRVKVEAGRGHVEAAVRAASSASQEILAAARESMDIIKTQIEWLRMCATLTAEIGRIKIVANVEKKDKQADFDEQEARWYLEVYQYGANMLAAIGGGTAHPATKNQPNKIGSALGGALSGAASGALIAAAGAGPVGTLAIGGAIIGGLAGLL